jgi:DNA polymerase I
MRITCLIQLPRPQLTFLENCRHSILKWMLVTCFGYTGYRNAKFGQIQVYEKITDTSREILLQIKEQAEGMGFEVLHGIVNCLWVVGEPISKFKEAVERETGILTEVDSYDWIAFLPMSDGTGAYNRYFGRLNTGKMKIRGVMARKGDTPEYVNKMQQEVFEALAQARRLEELQRVEPKVRAVRDRYMEGLGGAGSYEAIALASGMEIAYVVKDAKKWEVDSARIQKSLK